MGFLGGGGGGGGGTPPKKGSKRPIFDKGTANSIKRGGWGVANSHFRGF